MSFVALSLPTFLVGIAALAGVLFALHRLKVRHREVEVVTTLFWRQALEETRARVLVERFRHPWIYALLLAISALLWLAVARPRFDSWNERATEHVLWIDGSAAMARGTRFQDALAAARQRASELPSGRRRIVLATSRLETLLAPGEDLPTFDLRISGVAPEPVPSTTARHALEFARGPRSADGALAIEVFSTLPIDAHVVEALPKEVRLVAGEWGRATNRDEQGNAGVVQLGLSEPISGAFDAVDVFVEVFGASEPPALTLDGAALVPSERGESTNGTKWFVCRDVLARSGTLEARLPDADGSPFDDVASVVLPNRSPIRVQVGEGVPDSLVAAMRADRAVEIVTELPDLLVRRSNGAESTSVPTLEVAQPAAGTPAFVVRHVVIEDPERTIREAFDGLGLRDVDAVDLAERTKSPIEFELQQAAQRGFAIRADLLDERYDLIQSPAFPRLIARTLRWLANSEAIVPRAAAGDVAMQDRFPASAGDALLDPVGGAMHLPRAGVFVRGDGKVLRAALLDLASTSAATVRAGSGERIESDPEIDLRPWIAVLAFLLLALEWWLVRTERAP